MQFLRSALPCSWLCCKLCKPCILFKALPREHTDEDKNSRPGAFCCMLHALVTYCLQAQHIRTTLTALRHACWRSSIRCNVQRDSHSDPADFAQSHGAMAYAQAFHDAGWTRREVFNIANALSMGRLLSGPLVAHLIMQHHWPAALTTLAIAGTARSPGLSS